MKSLTIPRPTTTLFLASGNAGKLNEFRALSDGYAIALELLPEYGVLPEFPEGAPTFAENAVGKALYYSRNSDGMVLADDSGLVVPSLDGAPGVLSARYAGPGASDQQKIDKLIAELHGKQGEQRAAYFVCVIAVALRGKVSAVVSAKADGIILEELRGSGGFGYDPVFYFPELKKTFAELRENEKNVHSHRGKAFQRMIEILG